MDDYIMSFFMVETLLRKGYKHIIHIPGPAYIRNSYERLRGYRDALEKFHIEYQAQDVLSPALSAEEGSWVMERFLEKNVPFDAVLALRRLLCWEPRVLSKAWLAHSGGCGALLHVWHSSGYFGSSSVDGSGTAY